MTDNMPSQDPRIVRTREQAIAGTLALIAESGVQGVTFEAVSERSGVARSTLYRHWGEKSDLIADALGSQVIQRVAPDTGNLRDDMLTAMLGLGRELTDSTWGVMVAQVMAASALDPNVARVQEAASDYHLAIDIEIVQRAIDRGEVSEGINPRHIALLFSAPIFYRHLFYPGTLNARLITEHIDRTVSLLMRT